MGDNHSSPTQAFKLTAAPADRRLLCVEGNAPDNKASVHDQQPGHSGQEAGKMTRERDANRASATFTALVTFHVRCFHHTLHAT